MVKEPEAPKQRPARKGKGRRNFNKDGRQQNRAPKAAPKANAEGNKGGNE